MQTQVKYRGESARLHQLSLASVLPNTGDYITYEGRLVFLFIFMRARIVITGRDVIVQFLIVVDFIALNQGFVVMISMMK